jgi:hypothetical protein
VALLFAARRTRRAPGAGPDGTSGSVPAACAALQAAAHAPERVTVEVIECMLGEAYREDPKARDLALALFRHSGSVAGVGAAETMDGGYRGMIRLVPQLPLGSYRQHLRWVAESLLAFDTFFAELASAPPKQPAPAVPLGAPSYRWRSLSLRFVRSVAKRTPSAYAVGWAVTYNVRGSLLTSEAGVRETLFHEIFHLNDAAHDDWSARALATDYAAIVARCSPKLTRACLAPYAPNSTTVRGGTYYAFQQNNGESVREYAAELAVRYYKEHTELAATGKLARPPFKCGGPENQRAWNALVTEFFAGIDHTGPCP